MIYIDVRTVEEFNEGHYPGALNHPVELIMQGVMPDVPKDQQICVYCKSGGRAGVALDNMKQAGFLDIVNGGGLNDVLNNDKK